MKSENQPAYPFDRLNHECVGLTKLELLSAMAMQGTVACPDAHNPERIAEFSVKCAKALLAELEKETQ